MEDPENRKQNLGENWLNLQEFSTADASLGYNPSKCMYACNDCMCTCSLYVQVN